MGRVSIKTTSRKDGINNKKENIMDNSLHGACFGSAISALKAGKKVARTGWNGKGMFLYYVPANSYPARTKIALEYWVDKQPPQAENSISTIMVPYGAYIAMKTAQENVLPWLASQADMLADDWQIIE